MDHSVQSRIVQIELPLAGDRYRYFSGYIVADGLILTCLHGFSDNDGSGNAIAYNPERKIIVSAYDFEAGIAFEAKDFSALRSEDGFFQFASEKFDIALIACAQAKGVYH